MERSGIVQCTTPPTVCSGSAFGNWGGSCFSQCLRVTVRHFQVELVLRSSLAQSWRFVMQNSVTYCGGFVKSVSTARLNSMSQNPFPGIFLEPQARFLWEIWKVEVKQQPFCCCCCCSVDQVNHFTTHRCCLEFPSLVWGQVLQVLWLLGQVCIWSHDVGCHFLPRTPTSPRAEAVRVCVLVGSSCVLVDSSLSLLSPTSHLSVLHSCLPCRFQTLSSDAKTTIALQRLLINHKWVRSHAWDKFFNMYTPPHGPASLIEPWLICLPWDL